MDLTVITATLDRPKHLARLLQVVRTQTHTLKVEHLVVHDGPGDKSKFLCNQYGARYFETPEVMGRWGAGAKDLGIAEARGDYVVFWDDDNIYHPFALTTVFALAYGVDVGIAQCEWLGMEKEISRLVPEAWDLKTLAQGNVDTMCLCVRRETALKSQWYDDSEERGTDFRWLTRLIKLKAKVRFAPIIIGTHL